MKNLGLYIHIPFCDGKCAYCDFFSKKCDESQFDIYTEYLCNSIKTYSKIYKRNVDTIYFGGGTPSLLNAERLSLILSTIKNNFSVTSDAEITVECNPTKAQTLDFSKLKEAGFNRLSIGLQSAIDTELKILSRKHSAENAKETVIRAKNAGFDNISLDLMMCIPTQTKSSLARSIDFCKDCDVMHISAYILKIEENTPFFKMKDKLSLFDDDKQSEMYEFAVSYLREKGYSQYEISNFSKKGYESRHNLKYWHDEEYLGLGPSAHSFIDKKRFYFPRDFESFYNDNTVFESYGGDEEEYIMLALRLTEGLVFSKFEERYNHKLSDKIINKATKLQKEGLAKVSEHSISLTVKGFLVSNSVISYLLG